MKTPLKLVETVEPDKAPHGVLVMRLSRLNDFNRGGFDYSPTETTNDEDLRGQMFAEAVVNTTGFTGQVQITLTPTEVKTFNAIEARIAERLGKEIVAKGK